jgi:Coenzyme PQQ synthesis protein D (PqqD)
MGRTSMRLRSEGLSWREIDGEAVLLDLRSSTYFRTNRSGTLLLKALVDGDRDRDDLIARLRDSYGLTTDQAEHDVDSFVTRLRDRGLLTSSGAQRS